MANDPHWNKVVLGLKCDGTNGSTTFTDSSHSAKTVTGNGNAQISTAQSKFGGASAYFDGSGDYLSVANSTDWDFGSADFTVECFVYLGTVASAQGIVDKRETLAARGWSIYFDTSGGNKFWFTAGDSNTSAWEVAISSSAVTTGQFYHLAFCRKGSTFTAFVDGTSVGTASWSGSVEASSTPLLIGALVGPGIYLNGYIDDIRITKGAARYTANFTPPTTSFPTQLPVISGVVKDSSGNFAQRLVRAFDRKTGAFLNATLSNPTTGAYSLPVATADETMVIANDSATCDPYWGNVTLAMHMDGANNSTTFVDETGKTVSSAADAKISTTQSKFGGASAYFDGAGDYLSVASSTDFQFGTGDFTAELWIRRPALTTGNLIDVRPVGGGAGAYWALYFPSTTEISFYAAGGDRIRTTHGMVVDTWYHVAVCRASGVTRLFMDGTQLGSNYADTTSYLVSPVIVCASAHTLTDSFLNAYIDDLRITKGLARYTANFTPPTAAFLGPLSGGTENAVILDRVVPV